MQGLRSFSWRAMLGLTALALPVLAGGQTHYRLTTLGGSGHTLCNAYSINNAGMVAGQINIYNENHMSLGQAGCIWANGIVTLLPVQDTDSTGASQMQARCISNEAIPTIAGTFAAFDSSHNPIGYRGFMQVGAAFSNLGGYEPQAVNSHGASAGTVPLMSSPMSHSAYLYSNGVYTLVPNFGTDFMGNSVSEGYGLNDNGLLIGMAQAYDSSHAMQGQIAFSWDGTNATNLGNLGTDSNGNTNARAMAVNNAGQIAGNCTLYDSSHNFRGDGAFLYQNGAMTNLGHIQADNNGRSFTYPYGINSAGVVVGMGYVYDSGHNFVENHAFVYRDGHITDLNNLIPAGSDLLIEARSINDKGQICGLCKHNGTTEGFVLDPLPAGDVDSDGHADLLWQNPADGQPNWWRMNNLTYLGGAAPPTPPSADWRVVGTPDLNGDGKPDFLWQNSTTGGRATGSWTAALFWQATPSQPASVRIGRWLAQRTATRTDTPTSCGGTRRPGMPLCGTSTASMYRTVPPSRQA